MRSRRLPCLVMGLLRRLLPLARTPGPIPVRLATGRWLVNRCRSGISRASTWLVRAPTPLGCWVADGCKRRAAASSCVCTASNKSRVTVSRSSRPAGICRASGAR